MRTITTLLLLCAAFAAKAGDTLRVLFIGNSYVQVNNLPAMVADLAANQGHHLVFTDASVGGQTLRGHSSSANTLNQIRQPGWDFVVLQEQSQMPAFPDAQVAQNTYPYAKLLDSLVHVYNPCAKTVFYMTWGRKNGDAANCAVIPPICTYEGMDSLLRSRYTIMAQQNKSVIAPVSVTWRALGAQAPGIGLYQADESHPSPAGSYSAACTFYSIFFRADPSGITADAGLSAADAATIRGVAKRYVYDSLHKWYANDPAAVIPGASFTITVLARQVSFRNTSSAARRYRWDFGDGTSDTAASPVHLYPGDGSYNARLIAYNCRRSDTETQQIIIGPAAVGSLNGNHGIRVYPNPARRTLSVSLPQPGLSLTLTDLRGQAVYRQDLQLQRELSIGIAGLPAGRYLAAIVLADGTRRSETVEILP